MSKIATVQDKSGDVWTGKVVEPSAGRVITGVIADICTCGLAGLMSGNDTTVRVNDKDHTGQMVKK